MRPEGPRIAERGTVWNLALDRENGAHPLPASRLVTSLERFAAKKQQYRVGALQTA